MGIRHLFVLYIILLAAIAYLGGVPATSVQFAALIQPVLGVSMAKAVEFSTFLVWIGISWGAVILVVGFVVDWIYGPGSFRFD